MCFGESSLIYQNRKLRKRLGGRAVLIAEVMDKIPVKMKRTSVHMISTTRFAARGYIRKQQ